MPPKGNRGRGRGRGRPRTRSQGDAEGQSPPRPDTAAGTMDMDHVTNMIAQQIAAAVPIIVAQVNASQGTEGNRGTGTTENENRNRDNDNEIRGRGEGSRNKPSECSYKAFMACKPREFHGDESTIKTLHWIDEIEAIIDISKCAEEDKVRFVSHSFKSEALEWWNTIIQARGRDEANRMPWTEFTKELISKYCPQNEMEKLQTEFLSLSMDGKNILEYTQRFNALARLLPNLVTPEIQKVNRYIWGLDSRVRGLVKASQPATMKSAIELAAIVTDDRIRSGEFEGERTGNKRRLEEDQRNENSWKTAKVYQGTSPWCDNCKLHHRGVCNVCSNCKSRDHETKNCKKPEARRCFECGSRDHFRNTCPKLGKNKKIEGESHG